jgi:predicted Zn finger-like uncharacterized protein
MRIACPACDAAYDVPDAMLAGGKRVVRCARCGNEWSPMATTTAPPRPRAPETDFFRGPLPSPKPVVAPPADPEPPGRQEPRLNPLRPRGEARVPEPPPPPPPELPELAPRRSDAGAALAWVLSLLVLAAAAGAAVTWRAQVMAAWPPSERVFSAVGLR